MDLTQWRFDRDGPVLLRGEFAFFWKQFIPLSGAEGFMPDGYCPVPNEWNSFTVDGKRIGGDGYGTYRLALRLDPSLIGSILVIKIKKVSSAFTLAIDDRTVLRVGTIGTDAASSRPASKPSLVPVTVTGPELLLTFHVSNFDYINGGLYRDIYIGTVESIEREMMSSLLYDYVLFGMLLLTGLYHLGLFANNRRKINFLFFGLFCLIFALRSLVKGEYSFSILLQNFSWDTQLRLDFLTFTLGVPFFAGYLLHEFHIKGSTVVKTASWLCAAVFTILIVTTPSRVFSEYLIHYEIIVLLQTAWVCYSLIRSTIEKIEGAGMTLLALMALAITVVNDILYSMGVIQSTFVTPIGILIFIISQTWMLNKRFIISFIRTQNLKREKDMAEAANRAKSAFLANVSHEIRTPLNSIQGYIDLLYDTTATDEQKKYLDVVKKSARSLLGIVNDILDLSKVESGKLEISRAPFNVISELQSVIELFFLKATEKGIDLAPYLDPRIPPQLIGDALRIKQVLINLLGNAIKFTHDGGSISVEATLEREDSGSVSLRFTVADTGIGIAPEKQKAVFQAYQQEHGSIALNYGGTGLGLSISKKLVSLLGGNLSLESVPEKGSIFSFTLTLDKTIADWPMPAAVNDFSRLKIGLLSSAGEESRTERLLCRYLDALGLTDHTRLGPDDLVPPHRYSVLFVICDGDGGRGAARLAALSGTAKLIGIMRDSAIENSAMIRDRFDVILQYPLNSLKIIEALQGRAAAAAVGTADVEEAGPLRLRGKVLVAEDDASSQNLMKIRLENLGIDVDTADTGFEAMSKMNAKRYDLAFLDINMPGASGFEVAAKALEHKREHQQPHTPLIALTAKAITGDLEEILAAGFDACITKPLNYAKLRQLLVVHLEEEPQRPAAAPVASTAADHSSRADSYSIEAAAQQIGIDAPTLASIMIATIPQIEQSLAILGDAIRDGDTTTMVQYAHKLKGSFASIFYTTASAHASAIETGARHGGGIDYIGVHEEIIKEMDRLKQLLGIATACHS